MRESLDQINSILWEGSRRNRERPREGAPTTINEITLRAGYLARLVAPLRRGEDVVGFLVVRRRAKGFNITLERSLDPAAGQVGCFPQEITRALLNLISNGFYAATKRKEQDIRDGYSPLSRLRRRISATA